MNKEVYAQEKEDWAANALFYQGERDSPFQERFNRVKQKVYSLQETERTILDLGAGTGQLAEMFKKDGKRIVALDFVYEMAKIAKDNSPDLMYVVASAQRLPFKDAIFDAVIADGILHHMKAQGLLEEGLGEISRVLRRGGKLCMFDRNGSFFSRALLFLFVRANKLLRFVKGDYPSSSTRNEESLDVKDVQFIQRSGFKVAGSRYVSSLPFYLSIVFSNALQYLFGARGAGKIRNMIFPLASWFEERITSGSLTVEQCITFKREGMP